MSGRVRCRGTHPTPSQGPPAPTMEDIDLSKHSPMACHLCEVRGPLGPCLAFSSIPVLCLYGTKIWGAVGSLGGLEWTGRILLECAGRSLGRWCWKKWGFRSVNTA